MLSFAAIHGYETLHASEGYSNHLHKDVAFGRVDFMYVDEQTAGKLFAAASRRPVIGNLELPVARPEHLAAMKALSMKNSPGRVLIDSPDVQYLLQLPGVNRNEVRKYFASHGLLELFERITHGS